MNGIDHPLQTGQGDLYLYQIGTRWKVNGIVHPFRTGECVLYPIVMRWKVNGTDHPFGTGMCDLYPFETEGARKSTPSGKLRAWRESAGV